MNIAKALKKKNQIINDINKIKAKVKHNNSILKGNEPAYDIPTLLEQLQTKTDELISLKVKLTQANSEVQEKIYRIGELKSMITFYREVSVNQGKVKQGYNDVFAEYEAQLKQKERDDIIEQLEQEITELQDELDTFNYTHTITL